MKESEVEYPQIWYIESSTDAGVVVNDAVRRNIIVTAALGARYKVQ